MWVSTQVSCHCPHKCHYPCKCLVSVHTSVTSLSTHASCHYTHKHHVNIQTSITALSKLVFQTSVTSLSKLVFQTSVVIIQTSVASLSEQATTLSKQASWHYPNKRHVIIQTRQASRHYPNKTSVTSLFKQAPEPLYWHTPPDWYSRYENVHPYKLFTECTPVNRCCTTTSVNPCCTAADSFTRLLPTQCSVENIWHRFAAHSLPPCNRQGQKPFGVVWFVLLLYKCTPLGEV